MRAHCSRCALTRNLSPSERGSAAVDAGDLETAKSCFLEAVRADGRNASHRFHLAVVLEGLGEIDAAAIALTQALRLDRGFDDAARRLSTLANRYAVSGEAELDAAGLQAALRHDRVDVEIIAEVAIRQLASRDPLKSVLAAGRSDGWLPVAQALCQSKTGQLLKNELFLEVLRTSIFRHLDTERLLTSLRRVLLSQTPAARFADRALVGFAIALLQQCWANEHVWPVSAIEESALSANPVSLARLLSGDFEEARRLLLASLYRPLPDVLGHGWDSIDLGKLTPRVLRDAVLPRITQLADERRRAAGMSSIGTGADATARKVAQQYEANPYPRWTSVALPRAGSLQRTLSRFFTSQQLDMNRPYDVLIAGCGTGQQAVRAALSYGQNARVVGLDLSRASLAYASRMAEHFRANNLEFLQGDIQQLETHLPFLAHFQIIECTGVLHHMADPFQGWRQLAKCLAPLGLMLIGIYSAVSRRNITALRADPIFPGAGCNDTALRAFRHALMQRPDDAVGGELKISRDFYTKSNFRDLALHVSERPVTLAEIARFLEEESLTFKGFQLRPEIFSLFQERFPKEVWPGRLERWAEFEEEHPRLFDGMYLLWCAMN
jgi:SAM-dependent methyltransferase